MFSHKEVWHGIIGGLILPLFGSALVKMSFFPQHDWNNLAQVFFEYNILSDVIALSLLLNGGLFYVFLRMNKDSSAQGVVLSTFLWGIVCVVLKFV